jgi:cyclopropane fatty-acyl-phospholipid synthase-like methyltransferase
MISMRDGPASVATLADLEGSMSNSPSIESMPMYMHLDRVERELAGLGIGPDDPIRPEQLFSLDQWHYHGIDAVRTAVAELDLRFGSRVLDVGSGIGGPARFLAHDVGCHVTALELQPKLHAIASRLTRRCGLSERVTHLCGDALDYPLPVSTFDAVASWLALHHIADRSRLCTRLFRALRPGGGCYIEDLYMRSPFSFEDLQDVRNVLIGKTMTSIHQFTLDLAAAGFVDVRAVDLTDATKPFVAARLAAWRNDPVTRKHQCGAAGYAAMETFYSTVARLFENGSLGCVRLLASSQ